MATTINTVITNSGASGEDATYANDAVSEGGIFGVVDDVDQIIGSSNTVGNADVTQDDNNSTIVTTSSGKTFSYTLPLNFRPNGGTDPNSGDPLETGPVIGMAEISDGTWDPDSVAYWQNFDQTESDAEDLLTVHGQTFDPSQMKATDIDSYEIDGETYLYVDMLLDPPGTISYVSNSFYGVQVFKVDADTGALTPIDAFYGVADKDLTMYTGTSVETTYSQGDELTTWGLNASNSDKVAGQRIDLHTGYVDGNDSGVVIYGSMGVSGGNRFLAQEAKMIIDVKSDGTWGTASPLEYGNLTQPDGTGTIHTNHDIEISALAGAEKTDPAMFSVNGKTYMAIPNASSTNALYMVEVEYDPVANEWTRVADNPDTSTVESFNEYTPFHSDIYSSSDLGINMGGNNRQVEHFEFNGQDYLLFASESSFGVSIIPVDDNGNLVLDERLVVNGVSTKVAGGAGIRDLELLVDEAGGNLFLSYAGNNQQSAQGLTVIKNFGTADVSSERLVTQVNPIDSNDSPAILDAPTLYQGSDGTVYLYGQGSDNGVQSAYVYETGVEIVCFVSGTLISTESGAIAVESIKVGDMIETADNGYQAVRWIKGRNLDKFALKANPKLRPIRIRAGALGSKLPARDLLVSPQHRMLVKGKIARRMFDADEVLIPAKNMLMIEGVDVVYDVDEVTYYHFALSKHEVVFAEGAPSESLYLGKDALQSLPAESVEELYTLFPILRESNADQMETIKPARELVPNRLASKLVARHKHNKRPFLN